MSLIVVFILLVFFYGLFSEHLERSVVTAPILFTAAGMLMVLFLPDLKAQPEKLSLFLKLAEVGLVLLLFTDASRTNLQIKEHSELAHSPVEHGNAAQHFCSWIECHAGYWALHSKGRHTPFQRSGVGRS